MSLKDCTPTIQKSIFVAKRMDLLIDRFIYQLKVTFFCLHIIRPNVRRYVFVGQMSGKCWADVGQMSGRCHYFVVFVTLFKVAVFFEIESSAMAKTWYAVLAL